LQTLPNVWAPRWMTTTDWYGRVGRRAAQARDAIASLGMRPTHVREVTLVAAIPAPPQSPNFYTADPSLRRRLRRLLDPATFAWAEPILTEVGELAGGVVDRLAEVADKNRPVLRMRDACGDRIDEVLYHPAYAEMSRIAYEQLGLAQMVHRAEFRGRSEGAPQVVGIAAQYLFAQAEQGLMCPIIMTDCIVRSIERWGSAELKTRWLPRLTTLQYDDLLDGAMFFTERPGGSDVGASETVAVQRGDHWELHGEKWFCSNVSAGLILVTARPEGAPPGIRGIGCFLMPSRLPDGSRNRYRIERLKDKLGTWSMASGEVTLEGAVAYPVGPLDRGWPVAAEMVNGTRLSVAMGCAAAMRRAYFAARHHAAGRSAFGRIIMQYPMVQQNLIDLAVDVEAAQVLMLQVARAFDRELSGSPADRVLLRILTPLGKYWNAERGTPVVRAAMAVFGGIGYVEEWVTARLFRDVQVNQIWEGAPNVICLDVLRAVEKEGGLVALLGDLQGRLASIIAPQVVRLATAVGAALAAHGATFDRAVATADRVRLELAAHKLVQRLACLTVATLFAVEADLDWQESQDPRGLALAEAHLRRWLPDVAEAAGLSCDPLDDHDLRVFGTIVEA